MNREVTPRVAGLIHCAIRLIGQAQYEGDHVQRQEPRPSEGSPWDRPDAPSAVLSALRKAQEILEPALDEHFNGERRRIRWVEVDR